MGEGESDEILTNITKILPKKKSRDVKKRQTEKEEEGERRLKKQKTTTRPLLLTCVITFFSPCFKIGKRERRGMRR